MPAGNAVEVPDDASKSAFLKALIKDGSVVEVKELSEEEKAEAKFEALRNQAKMLGIVFDDEWSAGDLDKEIKAIELQNEEAAELKKLQEKAVSLNIEVKDGWDAKKLAAEIKKAEK